MSMFGHNVDGGLTDYDLMKGYVYEIKLKPPLLDDVRESYPDAPAKYTGVFDKLLKLKVDGVTGMYPSWIFYCMDGKPLPKSVMYFKHEININRSVSEIVYIFLDRKDIEISGPLKESIAETISKCTVSGGRKKRKHKRKSKRNRRN